MLRTIWNMYTTTRKELCPLPLHVVRRIYITRSESDEQDCSQIPLYARFRKMKCYYVVTVTVQRAQRPGPVGRDQFGTGWTLPHYDRYYLSGNLSGFVFVSPRWYSALAWRALCGRSSSLQVVLGPRKEGSGTAKGKTPVEGPLAL